MSDNEKNKIFRNYEIPRWLGFFGDFLVPVALGVWLSLWFSAGQRELAWEREWFDAGSETWTIGEEPLWQFIYRIASLPVLIVCGAAIVALILGYRFPALRAWKRIAWFAIALLLIGPGLIVNLWMKDHWGRPRPREVAEFGGRETYEPVFGLDFVGDGKSFPCGHATMGFYFLGAFFLLRRRFPRTSLLVLVAALAWGTLIGYGRMVQGGHFASDVVWAAVLMWISAAFLYRVLRLDRRLLDLPGDGIRRKIPWPARLAGGGGLIVLIAGILLATPYHDRRDIGPIDPIPAGAAIKGSLRIELGDVEILPGNEIRIRGEAKGHGVPTSQIAQRWEEEDSEEGVWRFKYLQRYSGRFTEIGQRLKISLPWERLGFIKIDLGPGETRMRLPEPGRSTKIEILLRDTHLVIRARKGTPIVFENLPAGMVIEGVENSATDPKDADGPVYRIAVSENTGGKIDLEFEE